MLSRHRKIVAIYEKIANKELTFGCRVIVETTWLCHSCSGWYDSEYTWIVYENCTFLWNSRDGQWISKSKEWNLIHELESFLHNDWLGQSDDNIIMEYFKWYSGIFSGQEIWEAKNTTYIHKIIWHPVMLGDVLDWIYDNEMTLFEHTWINDIIDTTIKLWIWNLREPIEDQSDRCIDYIYDLIK